MNSGGYIPRPEASSLTLWGIVVQYLANQMDEKTFLHFLLLKLSRNDTPFFSRFAKQVREPIKTRKKLLSTDLVNTNDFYLSPYYFVNVDELFKYFVIFTFSYKVL